MRQELIIIAAILLIGAGALGLEHLSPDSVRIIAIVLCFILLAAFIAGYVARARRRDPVPTDAANAVQQAAAATPTDSSPEQP